MFLIGLCMTCFGVPASIWAFKILYVLDNNSHAYLKGDLTEDDIAMIAIVGAFIAIAGICLMIFGKLKQKNKEISDSITNSTSLTYCTHCHINVNTKDGICPICNQKIGE